MDRRRFLAAGSTGIAFGIAGCLTVTSNQPETGGDETGRSDTSSAVATGGADGSSGSDSTDGRITTYPEWDPDFEREDVCPAPIDEGERLEFESQWLVNDPSDPLIPDGYHDLDTEREEKRRLTLITAETADRLRLEPVNDEWNNYDDEQRAFLRNVDFETSSLLAFEHELQGNEKFGVEAVQRVDETEIHAFTCRFGNPTPPGSGDPSGGDLGPNPYALFVRVDVPSLTAATVTHGYYGWWDDDYREPNSKKFETSIDQQ